jgi:hypothetical protein
VAPTDVLRTIINFDAEIDDDEIWKFTCNKAEYYEKLVIKIHGVKFWSLAEVSDSQNGMPVIWSY